MEEYTIDLTSDPISTEAINNRLEKIAVQDGIIKI
jgi:hypothetical protein